MYISLERIEISKKNTVDSPALALTQKKLQLSTILSQSNVLKTENDTNVFIGDVYHL